MELDFLENVMQIYGLEQLADILPDPVQSNQRRALHDLLWRWLDLLKSQLFFQSGNPGVNIYLDPED